MDVFDAVHTKHPGVAPIPTVIPSPVEYQFATHDGFRVLWVLFALMTLFTAVFALLSWNVPIARRVFYVITTLTTLISALAYFAMATGDASAKNCHAVRDHHKHVPDTHHDVCRQIFWARYVDWALTTPLLLLELSILSGISGAHTLMAVVANVIMVLSGLFSAFGQHHTAQKWGWYAISCISFIFVIWHVALHGTRGAIVRGDKTKKLFSSVSLFSLVLWVAYLVVWGIAPGARKMSVDTELIIYAILDILAKPVLGLWLIFAQRQNRESAVEIGGYWAHGLATEGRIRIGDDEAAA